MKILKAAATLLLSLLISAPLCGQEAKSTAATEEPGLGYVIASEKLDASAYTNGYFGLRLAIPEGWRTIDDESRRAIIELGKKFLKPMSAAERANAEKSISNTAILVTLMQTPMVPPVQASLLLGVERLPRDLPDSPTGYVIHLKHLVTEISTLKYSLDRDVREEQINGLPFVAFDVSAPSGDIRIKQRYSCQLRKGYALCFIETYGSDAQFAALNQVLAGLTIK